MSKPYGLVLSGGGAKGSYQMGAWQAMREMRIKFSSVAGVSIGAINGALIVSNNYKDAIRLWNSVTLDKGVKIDSELIDPDNLFSSKNYGVLIKEIFKNRGIDASPTRDFLNSYIEEQKVRESGIPFGFVTYSLSSLTPTEMFIDDIPDGQLIDYLLASAKYPGVSKIGPDDQWFIDGGIYDNTPVSLLRRRGINRLVVIDISSMKGMAHNDDFSCAEVVYIRPYNPEELGAAFDFSDEMIKKRLTMGYLDAKKSFGRLQGGIYYFSPMTFRSLITRYGADACEQLEKLAYEIGLDRLKIYREKEFLTSLKLKYMEYELEKTKEDAQNNFIENIVRKFTKEKNDYPLAAAILDDIIV